MFQKLMRAIALICLLSGFPIASVKAQDALPTTKDAWIAKLSSLSGQNGASFRTIRQFIAQDPELTYTVLRDGWASIKDRNVRSQLVSIFLRGGSSTIINGVEQNPYTANPHLLDIFGIWLREDLGAGQQVMQQQQILQELLGIAFEDISGAAEYKKWRDSIGDRPINAVIQESCRRVVNDLVTGDADRRLKTLALLQKITYYTGMSTSSSNGVTTRTHYASGLMKVRRDALLEANLPAALGKLLRPENPPAVREASVQVLARLRPEDEVLVGFESDLKRELPPLLDKPAEVPDRRNPFVQPANYAELLVAFSGDWAVDLIIKLLQKSAEGNNPNYTLVNAMQETRNPRVIPTLIGLLDLNDSRRIGFNPFENVLRQITRVGWNGTDTERTHDSVWWRLWWHDNKKQYPAEVQKLPIPNFHKVKTDSLESAHPVASRRRLERVLVSEDPKRAYWLLAPGWVPSLPMTDAEKSAVANSGLKRLAAVKEDRPGLIVVLQDGDADEPSLLDPWLDVADALDRRYYVAVAIRPRWNEKAAGQWLTQKDRAAFPMAQFSTEAFAEQIVQQLKLNVSLNPDHIFLVAEGKAGTAGYACALQKSTAFQGFCLLSAPLRTTLLPPLPAAKNRRFFLALGIEGMGGTDSLAAAAEPLLKQQGAQIQAERVKSGSIADGVQHAVRWLETK